MKTPRRPSDLPYSQLLKRKRSREAKARRLDTKWITPHSAYSSHGRRFAIRVVEDLDGISRLSQCGGCWIVFVGVLVGMVEGRLRGSWGATHSWVSVPWSQVGRGCWATLTRRVQDSTTECTPE